MEFTWLSRWQPQLLAVLRIVTALLFLEHGMMKLFHFPAAQMPGPLPPLLIVAAAIELAEFHDLPHLWLVGWSFGTELALRYGRDPAVEGAILLSPPLRRATDDDLAAWAAFGRPLVALVPEHDDFLVPAQAEPHFAGLANAEMIAVAGARHLWVGEAQVRRVLDEIVAHVLPGHGPLPTTWDGPSTQAPGSADRTGEDA